MASVLCHLQERGGGAGTGSHPAPHFLAPDCLLLGEGGQTLRDRLPCPPLHSLTSPFETVAHDLGAVHRPSQNLAVELTSCRFAPCSVRLLCVLKLPP